MSGPKRNAVCIGSLSQKKKARQALTVAHDTLTPTRFVLLWIIHSCFRMKSVVFFATQVR